MPGKRIQVDEDTLVKLTDLGRHRMATFQELDALKKSVKQTGARIEKPFPRKRGVKRPKKQRAR